MCIDGEGGNFIHQLKITYNNWLRDTMLRQQHTYGHILNGVHFVINLMYWSLVYVFITD